MRARMSAAFVLVLSAVFILLVLPSLFAAPLGDRPPGAMEFLGIGPELFADRAAAWVEAIGVVAEKAIAKLGVLILAALALRKTILSNAKIEERLDRQAERIHEVAVASAPSSLPVEHINEPTVISPGP